jgi:hypothetical protein
MNQFLRELRQERGTPTQTDKGFETPNEKANAFLREMYTGSHTRQTVAEGSAEAQDMCSVLRRLSGREPG